VDGRGGSAAPLAETLWLSVRTLIDLRGYASPMRRRSLKSIGLIGKAKPFRKGSGEPPVNHNPQAHLVAPVKRYLL